MSDSDKIYVTRNVSKSFLIPSTPNYIFVHGDEKTHVKDLPEDVLQAIGEKWTEALIRKAKNWKSQPAPTGQSGGDEG